MELTEVLRYGIITEESVDQQNLTRNVGRRGRGTVGEVVPKYTFKVALEANKIHIRQAVEAMWPGLKVVQVNTMRMPGKARTVRTRKGALYKEARPWKKAIVTLASGQSIPELQA
jgi:large subunit ribosomal protein L23